MRLTWRYTYPPIPLKGIRRGSENLIYTSLSDKEALELQRLATDKVCLEIGAAYGFSTITMAITAKRVVSIDHHQTHSLKDFKSNLRIYNVADKVDTWIGMADDTIEDMIGDNMRGIFDLAFIDGGHDAISVRTDALNCLKMIKPNGILVFHDYHQEDCPEVALVLDEIFPGKGRIVDTLFIYQKE